MFVNGVKISQNADLRKELEKLPSSFPHYRSKIINCTITKKALYNEALSLYKKREFPEAEEKFLEIAVGVSESDRANNLFYADLYMNIACVKFSQEKYEVAKRYFEDSLRICVQFQDYNRFEIYASSLAKAYDALEITDILIQEQNTLLEQATKIGDQEGQLQAHLMLGAAHKILKKDKDAVMHYAKAYAYKQGKVDYGAHRIEQHEVGFSDHEKIGTDNIQQCVAVILHDPISKKSALAHIDAYTDAGNLSEVIKKFPSGVKLDVYLIGGRDRTNGRMTSDANIKKTLKALKNYDDLNFKTGDIGDKKIPSAITFDPQTGKLEHAVPGRHDKSTPIRMAQIELQGKVLYHAFDFTESKNIDMPELDEQKKIYYIRQYLHHSLGDDNHSWKAAIQISPLRQVVEDIEKQSSKLKFKKMMREAVRLEVKEMVKSELSGKNIKSYDKIKNSIEKKAVKDFQKGRSMQQIEAGVQQKLSNIILIHSIEKQIDETIKEKNINFIEGFIIKNTMFKYAYKSFVEDIKPVFKINAEIKKFIIKSTESKTLWNRIKNPFNWGGMLSKKYEADPHISVTSDSPKNESIKDLTKQQKNNLDAELEKIPMPKEIKERRDKPVDQNSIKAIVNNIGHEKQKNQERNYG